MLYIIDAMTQPFDLNLRHLRALPLIAERGSMSAAAEAIGLSQPALAQGLAKLEERFGALLFERFPDGMRATPAGARVIPRVHAAHDRLARAMRPLGRGGRRAFERPENLLTATQVRALLNLAEAGSFVGAARATGLSQPALHRAVRELEGLCDTPLAERQGRGVALTTHGRRLARQFRLVAADLQAALEEAQAGATGSHLAIGAMPLCRAVLLPTAVATFARAQPASHIDIVEGSYAELSELLRDGRIDLMIGALRDPCPPDFTQRALFVDRLMIAARAGHPLAGEHDVPASDLCRFPWIVGRAGSPLRHHWERLFEGTGLPYPPAPVECGSVMAIRGILLDSDFLTLVSPDQIALELRAGLLARVPAALPSTERIIGVTTRADWQPTANQRHFLDILDAGQSGSSIPQIE
ncbi:MAG: LysR family transcriptional regulator [Candidatus Sphingomonas colombiensis]|nr:LysR family transcriptional regulator [Sphingomonas sp.]WEK41690.1 MAG: LysR family transcriptional regulator [Sphingomonas sp.]